MNERTCPIHKVPLRADHLGPEDTLICPECYKAILAYRKKRGFEEPGDAAILEGGRHE